MRVSLLFFLLLSLTIHGAFAKEIGAVTKLPVPRFVTVQSESVYVRTGPGTRFPVKWVYKRAGLPVEIIQEYDIWRKVRDADGEEGWINQALLSGRRSVLVKGTEPAQIYKKPDVDSKVVAVADPDVQLALKRCDADWCQVSSDEIKGFVERKRIWGIYEAERFE